MFSFFKFTTRIDTTEKTDQDPTGKITFLPNGRWGLFDGNEMVTSYCRERDAKRGATRRGISLA